MCIPNTQNVDVILKLITNMGFAVGAAASSKKIQTFGKNHTSMLGLHIISDSKVIFSELVEMLKTSSVKYYSIVLDTDDVTHWDVGNFSTTPEKVEKNIAEEPITIPKPDKITVESSIPLPSIDTHTLLSVLKSSIGISDIFFDISKEQRMILYSSMENLIEKDGFLIH
jgi:hypothetical protein